VNPFQPLGGGTKLTPVRQSPHNGRIEKVPCPAQKTFALPQENDCRIAVIARK
jgi:hypothetical protein